MWEHESANMVRAEGCGAKRPFADRDVTISYDQTIDLLKEIHAEAMPGCNDTSSVTLGENSVVFYSGRELERLVENYEDLTEEQTRRLASIPWFRECFLRTVARTSEGPRPETKDHIMRVPRDERCVDVYASRVNTTRSKRTVTKHAKIRLLQIFYPKEPPTWRDELPIILEDNNVWIYRPTHFMDDIASSWLGGKAVLSESEQREMEKLSWFETWLDNIASRRKRKKCELSNEAVYESTD